MRKIIAAEYLSLDGVMEDPAWTAPYWNEELEQAQTALLFACDARLLGRVTYEGFAAAWPRMGGDGGFGDRMNALPKHVVSTTLQEPAWNARFIRTDVVAEIIRLKAQPGRDLLLYGSATLLATLRQHDLVDEYRLMVCPLVLGSGRPLFAAGSAPGPLTLLTATHTRTGVQVLTFGRAESAGA